MPSILSCRLVLPPPAGGKGGHNHDRHRLRQWPTAAAEARRRAATAGPRGGRGALDAERADAVGPRAAAFAREAPPSRCQRAFHGPDARLPSRSSCDPLRPSPPTSRHDPSDAHGQAANCRPPRDAVGTGNRTVNRDGPSFLFSFVTPPLSALAKRQRVSQMGGERCTTAPVASRADETAGERKDLCPRDILVLPRPPLLQKAGGWRPGERIWSTAWRGVWRARSVQAKRGRTRLDEGGVQTVVAAKNSRRWRTGS